MRVYQRSLRLSEPWTLAVDAPLVPRRSAMVRLRCALQVSAALAPSCTHCSRGSLCGILWVLLTSIDILPIVPIWEQHGPVPPLPGSRGIAMNFAFRSREHTWALGGETSLRLYLQHVGPCREWSIFWGSHAFSCHLCRGTLCLASLCGCLLKYFILRKELAHRSHHLRAAATNEGLLSNSILSWFLSFCFCRPSASGGFHMVSPCCEQSLIDHLKQLVQHCCGGLLFEFFPLMHRHCSVRKTSKSQGMSNDILHVIISGESCQ